MAMFLRIGPDTPFGALCQRPTTPPETPLSGLTAQPVMELCFLTDPGKEYSRFRPTTRGVGSWQTHATQQRIRVNP